MASKYAGAQGSFSAQIQSFVDQTKADMEELFRVVVIQIGTSIIKMSPVGNQDLWQNPSAAPPGYVGGRFRGEWQFSIDNPAESQNGRIDPSGGESVAELVDGALMLQVGQTAWIVNLLPYAIPLEYGHSDQAPNGMVRITVARFQQIVEEAARNLRH